MIARGGPLDLNEAFSMPLPFRVGGWVGAVGRQQVPRGVRDARSVTRVPYGSGVDQTAGASPRIPCGK